MKEGGAKTPSSYLLHGAMLLCALLVSTSFIVAAAITPHLDPILLTLLRFILASVLFAPFALRGSAPRLPAISSVLRYGLISAALVGFFLCMFTALRSTSPLNTAVIFTTVPGLSGIYSWVLLRERLEPSRIAALALAMVGAVWVIFDGNLEALLNLRFHKGDLIFFFGCLLMGLYTPLVKLLHRGEPMSVMTWWILLTGVLWLGLAALTRLTALPQVLAAPAGLWLGIGYLAVFTTIFTFFLSQWATLFLGPTRVMAYSYLYPGFIVLIHWIGQGNPPSLQTLMALLLVFPPAMYLVQRSSNESTYHK